MFLLGARSMTRAGRQCRAFFFALFIYVIVLPVFFSESALSAPELKHPRSAMFYYGSAPLPDELALFDIIVIDSAAADDLKNRAFPPESVYGYVSLGEMRKDDPLSSQIDPSWIKGGNPTWQAHAMDQTASGWRQFFLDRIVAPLRGKGIRNVFIDTMDSYQLFAKTPEDRSRQEAGLIATIRELKAKYPDMKIMLNRGFEVIEPLKDVVNGMAVESLFRSWHQADQRYGEVSENDRNWLLGQIRRVRDTFGIPVVVIDYVAPAERELARRTAQQISNLGFVPCITSGSLTTLGISTVEPLPRTILFLHEGMKPTDFSMNDPQRFGVMPLNYLGYRVEYLDVSEALPTASLAGRYAGIVSWLEKAPQQQREYENWILKQRMDGIPIVLINSLGAAPESPFMQKLGFAAKAITGPPAKVTVSTVDSSLAGFEMQLFPVPDAFIPLVQKDPSATVLLDLVDDQGRHMHAAALTSWGGYVMYPFVLRQMGDANIYRWIINPMIFYQKALRLPVMPVPDLTTHNGRRILFAHIDGDGAVSRAEMNPKMLANRMMLEEILKRYRIPTTVSVIEGETSPRGLYPELSATAEQTYREIFSLPHIEPASHSFSHPFSWSKAAKNTDEESYHLNIPGYSFDLRREILGSLDYVRKLAPAGKQPLFLWTGDCNPDTDALDLLERAGVLSMNGGDTVITKENPSWTAIAPIGIHKGPYFQVYAPNQNENMYTDLWTKRFYGYERVIETFQLTDRPYRFKPINIYYHMYSATKPASLNALRKVYDYALRQDVVAVFASEYIRKAREFSRVAVGRTENGYRVAGTDAIRELRIPKTAGYPVSAGGGVIGFSDHEQARYLHLAPGRMHDVVLQKEPGRGVYLESVNAAVPRWTPVGRGVDFSLLSHQAGITMRLGNMQGCTVRVNGIARSPRMVGSGIAQFEIKGKEDVLQTVSVRCAD